MIIALRRVHVALIAIPLFALIAGVLVVRSSRMAEVAVIAPIAAVVLAHFRGRLTWVSVVTALGGSMILGYGFVNIAVTSNPPVPLVDLLLVLSFASLALSGVKWPEPRQPFVLVGVLFGYATLRLFFDEPTWHSAAFRDYTTYVEMSSLFVGYWTLQLVGLRRWIKALTWISGLTVAYGLLTIDGSLFNHVNVTVGLQKRVLLLGHLSGVSSVSAFFFFVLLRRPSFTSAALAAAAIPPLFTLQSRGLYLALPLALVVVVAVRAFQPQRGGMRFAKALAVGAVASALVLAVHPTGRFGGASASLIKDQLLTLVGKNGVGSGSIGTRKHWFTEVNQRVSAHGDAIVYGLGLGPDLANGFTGSRDAPLVRKPHDDYLEMYGRLGLPALMVFVFAIGAALARINAGRRRARDPVARDYLVWSLANSIIYLFIAGTQPLLAYPFGTIPLFGIMGAALAVAAGKGADDAPETAAA
jgi:hypothetical protein